MRSKRQDATRDRRSSGAAGLAAACVGLSALLLCAGCSSYAVEQSGRRHTDQSVVATCVHRAVQRYKVPDLLVGRNVLVRITSPSSMEEKFLSQDFTNHLAERGVKIVSSSDDADYEVLLMTDTSGLDVSNYDLVIPVIFSPTPINLYSEAAQKGFTRFVPIIYKKGGTEIVQRQEVCEGRAYHKRLRLLIFGPMTWTDIHKEKLDGR